MLKAEEVQSILGIPECAAEQSESETEDSFHAELIMSPSRRQARSAARWVDYPIVINAEAKCLVDRW